QHHCQCVQLIGTHDSMMMGMSTLSAADIHLETRTHTVNWIWRPLPCNWSPLFIPRHHIDDEVGASPLSLSAPSHLECPSLSLSYTRARELSLSLSLSLDLANANCTSFQSRCSLLTFIT